MENKHKKTILHWGIPILLGIGLVVSVSLASQLASIIIAGSAAIFAGVSALLALRSLEFTGALVRPFITISYYEIITTSNQADTEVVLWLRNVGSLPADSVSVDTVLVATNAKDGDEKRIQEDTINRECNIFSTDR